MKRIREVASAVSRVIADLRERGYDEGEILAGLAIAMQAAPVGKLMKENAAVGRVVERGWGIAREIGKLVSDLRGGAAQK